jgi:hypothetical protein
MVLPPLGGPPWVAVMQTFKARPSPTLSRHPQMTSLALMPSPPAHCRSTLGQCAFTAKADMFPQRCCGFVVAGAPR